jgi:hypothetical protein
MHTACYMNAHVGTLEGRIPAVIWDIVGSNVICILPDVKIKWTEL